MEMTALARDGAAISLLALCQAVDLRGGRDHLGIGTRAVFETVRKAVTVLDKDRPLDNDIARTSELIRGRLLPLPEMEDGL